MARFRNHPDRTVIELALGGTLVALGGILLGFFVVAPHHWHREADLALLALGLVCLLFGLYIFAQYYFGWLPALPPPRQRHTVFAPVGFPDVEIVPGGQLFRRNIEMEAPERTVVVELFQMRVTNHERTQSANLVFQLFVALRPGSMGSLTEIPLPLYPPRTPGIALDVPLNLGPQQTAVGSLAFLLWDLYELASADVADEGVLRLTVHDFISGVTLDVPLRAGGFRPNPGAVMTGAPL